MNNLVALLGIIIWPVLTFYVIIRYDKEFRELIKRIKKISGGGLSAEMTDEVNEIARKVSEISPKDDRVERADKDILNLESLAESDPPLALANVRVEIENQLQLLYKTYLPERAGSGRMLGPRSILESLQRRNIIESSLAAALQDIINVTNRSIHGQDISSQNALKLVDTANRVWLELQYVLVEHALETIKTETIDGATVDEYRDARYLLTTITPLVERPRKSTYELNQAELDAFLDGYNEYAEFIVELKKIDKDDNQLP